MLAFLFLSAALLVAPGGEKLSRSEQLAWRTLVTEVVTQPQQTLDVESIKEFERFDTAELARVARLGPNYDSDSAKAREVNGAKETLESFGRTTSGYSFEYEGHVYRYAVSLPRKYEPSEAWPLLLDPGHGSGAKLDAAGKAGMLDYYRNMADEAGGRDWIVIRTEIIEQVGAGGLHKPLPEDEVIAVYDAFFRDVYSRFHVDLSQVRVAGISQTGFWAWYLAAARPSRFAGLAPAAAVTWQVDPNLENLRNLAIFVAHGDQDEKCPVEQPRVAVRRLANLGARVLYHEIAEAGHDGKVFWRIAKGLEFLKQHPRDPYPKQISKACANLREGGWAYWLRIDELEREDGGEASVKRPALGGVDGKIEGQEIRLHSEGVKRVTLGLSSELLDLDQSITVIWNGKTVHEGKLQTSAQAMLELIGSKADWIGVFEAKLELTGPKR